MRAFCIMLIAGAVIGSAPRLRAEAQLVNGVDAVVHDSVVTFSEVEVMTLPAEDVLERRYRDQPEVFQKKLTDARNDNLEQLMERQLILHDFKTTFAKPEQQAVVDKVINKDIDQEIEAEIQDALRRQPHVAHPDLAGGGHHAGTASPANSRPAYRHLAAPEEYFVRDHRLAAPGGGVLPGAPR